MPRKEIVRVDLAVANTNLSPATKFGNLVFVAGQTGRHPVTGELGRDIREQTRNVLERIKVILAAAGTSLDNVLSAMTHLTRVENLAAYNEEYAKYFPTDKPARTTVTVAALNQPELLIEVTVIAGIPG
jgi:2-iminobutanoate/2-iminopropanoate deaminase